MGSDQSDLTSVVREALRVFKRLERKDEARCCTRNAMAGWAPCDECQSQNAEDLPKAIVVRPKKRAPIPKAPYRDDDDDRSLDFHPVGTIVFSGWAFAIVLAVCYCSLTGQC